MKELLNKVTAWLVIASLVIGAAICGYAGWQGRGWWERRKRPQVSTAIQVPPTAPTAPQAATSKPKKPYVPPEAKRPDLSRFEEAIALLRRQVDSLTGYQLVLYDFAGRYAIYYHECLDQDSVPIGFQDYLAAGGVKPPEVLPVVVSPDVRPVYKRWGVGIWPGISAKVEVSPDLAPAVAGYLDIEYLWVRRFNLAAGVNNRSWKPVDLRYRLPLFTDNLMIGVNYTRYFDGGWSVGVGPAVTF